MLSESGLGAFEGLLVEVMEESLRKGILGEQYMIQNARNLVGGRGDGRRRSELGAHASEEVSEIPFGATERVGSHP